MQRNAARNQVEIVALEGQPLSIGYPVFDIGQPALLGKHLSGLEHPRREVRGDDVRHVGEQTPEPYGPPRLRRRVSAKWVADW